MFDIFSQAHPTTTVWVDIPFVLKDRNMGDLVQVHYNGFSNSRLTQATDDASQMLHLRRLP
jgi:hypothetical protein